MKLKNKMLSHFGFQTSATFDVAVKGVGAIMIFAGIRDVVSATEDVHTVPDAVPLVVRLCNTISSKYPTLFWSLVQRPVIYSTSRVDSAHQIFRTS